MLTKTLKNKNQTLKIKKIKKNLNIKNIQITKHMSNFYRIFAKKLSTKTKNFKRNEQLDQQLLQINE